MLHIHHLIDDSKCYEEVRRLRWPYGIGCPHCDSNKIAKRGMIMLALGSVLLVKPELMNDIGSSILIFGVALLASLTIMWAHRRWGGSRERVSQ